MLTAKEARENATSIENIKVNNLLKSCLSVIEAESKAGKLCKRIYLNSKDLDVKDSVLTMLVQLGYRVEYDYFFDQRDGDAYWFEINW